MHPVDLRCEYLRDPAGLDVTAPRLNWILAEPDAARRNQRQTAYRIQVAGDEADLAAGRGLLWDSGRVVSAAMNQIAYAGARLGSLQRCVWRVRVWDGHGRASAWSGPARWSMGLLRPTDLLARWIEAPGERTAYTPAPAPLFRRAFAVRAAVRRATLVASALGVYELHLNGRRVGDHELAPEWTDYRRRVQYQTYEVADLLLRGENVLGAILGDGWYAGRLGLQQHCCPPGFIAYGTKPAFLAQLRIVYADGQGAVIGTGRGWTCTLDGPTRSAGILDGEVRDARRELPGWSAAGFDASAWRPVRIRSRVPAALVAQRNEPIRITAELPARALSEPRPGIHIADLGQNMVGWVRLRLRAPAGRVVVLRYAEMLQPDGTIYRDNLRLAGANAGCQIDRYTAAGTGVEIFAPRFTYHGFRYVEITGLDAAPALDDITGCVVNSAVTPTGALDCSDGGLKRLWRNIVWTQRGNLMGVPTDCPQRDERLGWSGDAQVFAQTAMFGMGMAAFFGKWLRDMRDGQAADGRFPDFAPHPFDSNRCFAGNPGWGDAGVIVPWRMYENYGDLRLLREHYPAARRWVASVARRNPDGLWKNSRNLAPLEYGDWLNGDTLVLEGYPRRGGEVPRTVYATAFYAYSTALVARMAAVLGRRREARGLERQAAAIRTAFNRAFVADDGRIEGDTQAGYALALAFDLLPARLRAAAAARMVRAVEAYQGRISTGIQSTIRLMLALSRFGHDQVAWNLLTSTEIPSWLYMLRHDATTVWERWDGWVENRGFQNPGMNSFNHYALGAVGEWMMRHLVGIAPDPDHPGFARALISPRIPADGRVAWASGHHDTIRGRVSCRWERTADDRIRLELQLPPNLPARIHLPVGGRQLTGPRLRRSADGTLGAVVGSGRHIWELLAR